MAKVTVYKIRRYDITSDEFQYSRRMATEEGAALMGGSIVPETALEIDQSQLENGEQWTPRNFGLPKL